MLRWCGLKAQGGRVVVETFGRDLGVRRDEPGSSWVEVGWTAGLHARNVGCWGTPTWRLLAANRAGVLPSGGSPKI